MCGATPAGVALQILSQNLWQVSGHVTKLALKNHRVGIDHGSQRGYIVVPEDRLPSTGVLMYHGSWIVAFKLKL